MHADRHARRSEAGPCAARDGRSRAERLADDVGQIAGEPVEIDLATQPGGELVHDADLRRTGTGQNDGRQSLDLAPHRTEQGGRRQRRTGHGKGLLRPTTAPNTTANPA